MVELNLKRDIPLEFFLRNIRAKINFDVESAEAFTPYVKYLKKC